MTDDYTSVDEHLANRGRLHGDSAFVVDIERGRSITYADTDRWTARLAHLLDDLGLSCEDRVSVLTENTVESVVAYLGVQRHGAAVNPVNIRADLSNAGRVLSEVAPKVVLHALSDAELVERLRSTVHGARWIGYLPLEEPERPADELFSLLDETTDSPWEGLTGDTTSPAIIAHTSGSTGRPKGVVHSRGSLDASTRTSVELVGLTDHDRLLEFRDLSWLSPQVLTIAASVATGATALLAPTFSRSRFLEWLTDHDVTVAVGVPSVINMLLEDRGEPVDASELFPRLRFMTSSTAPLSPERQREFESHYGIEILQFMGMSEAGWIAGNRIGHRKLGTVGPAAPRQHTRICDAEGTELPPGVEGEVFVGGPQVALGYLTEEGLVPIGDRDAVRTGDLGRVDDDGFLTVTGRIKDLIIRRGVNISPAEVTAVVESHPAVVEGATIGVPDPIDGERPVSFASVSEPVEPAALVAHCSQELSAAKAPAEVLLVDEIPRTARQKVDTDALRSLWSARTEPPVEPDPTDRPPDPDESSNKEKS